MARKTNFDYDLIVIGSGAAGSTAALAVQKAGKKVALVEADVFGGESPNWGDIPTKAVLHALHLYDEARRGSRFGIRSSMLGYNYPSVMQWKDKAISRTGSANNRKYYDSVGVETFAGNAYFLSPHEISVNRKHITAQQFLIATGSHFGVPEIYGIETIQYHTPRTLLEIARIPRSLFIVGGSSEAVEFAQLFATFGTKVYISERSERILPDEDSEVGEFFESYLHDTKGITTLTQTQITGVEKKGLGVRVSLTRGATSKSIQVDEILFMDNRTPTTDIGLENASVTYTPAGIGVNDQLQTSAAHIYAAGTVLGDACPTHVAMLQGQIVARNIIHKQTTKSPDTSTIPRVTFTSPGIASVGLSEDDCLRRDLHINTATAPLSMTARANVSDANSGFVKLISDKKGVLLGGTIIAPAAAEMINEVSLALHHGMTASDLASTPHAFLTWSEAVRIAAVRLTK